MIWEWYNNKVQNGLHGIKWRGESDKCCLETKLDNLGSLHILCVGVDANYDAYKLMVALSLPRPQENGLVSSRVPLVFLIAAGKSYEKCSYLTVLEVRSQKMGLNGLKSKYQQSL